MWKSSQTLASGGRMCWKCDVMVYPYKEDKIEKKILVTENLFFITDGKTEKVEYKEFQYVDK